MMYYTWWFRAPVGGQTWHIKTTVANDLPSLLGDGTPLGKAGPQEVR
jgi:hypothetical protein